MAWPTPQDYQEAMQNPCNALGNPELQTGRVEEDQLGLPRPISGGFASVYKVFCPSRTWAVRCFLKEFLDQQQRYAAISNQLAISKFPFATHFEFFQQGIRIRGNWYPIVKMEWVQGESLTRFVENNIHSPQKLLSVGLDVVEIARVLNRAGVAHGDLQHGNILVSNGKPKLIDYDGMYVPALRGWQTHEAGHPNYQLPRDDSDFGPGLDNFSVWVIYLSLRALSIRPTLWSQFQGGDDCLIFRRADFEEPARSAVLQELKRFPEPEIKQLTTAFESLLSLSPLKVPMIDPGLPKAAPPSKPTADWLYDHLPHPPPQPTGAAFNLANKLAQINQIPRPSDIYTIWHSPGVSPTPWPLLPHPPVSPAVPGILVSPPAFPTFEPPPAQFHPAVVPIDSLQYSIGVAALIFIALTPLSAGLGVVVGALGAGNPLAAAFVAGVGFFVGAVLFTTWWTVLEVKRRQEEKELNHEYQEERRLHKALQQEHVERCKKRLKEQQDQARRKYDELVAKWNGEILPYKQETARRREAFQGAKSRLQRAELQWKTVSDAAIQLFDRKKAELGRLKDDYDAVENQREAELKQMLAKARENQFHAHLRQHLVEHAVIDNIGPARRRALKSAGVLTAMEVSRDRIKQIQGFGDALADNIVKWRRDQVETSFIFKTAKAIAPHEMQAFESKYQHLRQLIQRRFDAVEQELTKISLDAATQLSQLTQQIKACMNQLGQAETDLTVIPRSL